LNSLYHFKYCYTYYFYSCSTVVWPRRNRVHRRKRVASRVTQPWRKTDDRGGGRIDERGRPWHWRTTPL